MRCKTRAFTLLELLVVMGIIAIVVAIVVPAMSRVRSNSRTTVCQTHLRELARGWDIYADENDEVMLPGRMANQRPKGPTNPQNWQSVGNGLKYRPRWPAVVSAAIGVFAYDKPEPMPGSRDSSAQPNYDRQDYDNELLACPSEPTWIDERNYGYGYNLQFLGNARQTNGIYHNFPVRRHRVRAPGGTVVMADSLGTAAAFTATERRGYRNDGKAFESKGNHGWALDPPRLTEHSDRGTGDKGSPRTAVDTRHQKKTNAAFADGHVALKTDEELGYRKTPQGRYVDLDPDEGDASAVGGVGAALQGPSGSPPRDPSVDAVRNPAHNRLFSGTGRDDDPPKVPGR